MIRPRSPQGRRTRGSARTLCLAAAAALMVFSRQQRGSTDALQNRGGAARGHGSLLGNFAAGPRRPGYHATVRSRRVTKPGDAVRIRLDNVFGQDAVQDRAARFVGVRVQGALLAARSKKPDTFAIGDGFCRREERSGAIHPVEGARQLGLAISCSCPARTSADQHTGALGPHTYGRRGGDSARRGPGPAFSATLTSTGWLEKPSMCNRPPPAARLAPIVAFGDSITDGTCSDRDATTGGRRPVVRLGLQHMRDGAPGGSSTS